MKSFYRFFGLLLGLCLLLSPLPSFAETYIDQGGNIPDQKVYTGGWKESYLQILQAFSASIYGYQERKIDFTMNQQMYAIPCFPIGIEDLTGDGIPELFFLEKASGGTRGDFRIYSSDGSSARCVLYVPGITRLDYDDMLGFQIYLSSDGGSSLVIEQYVYEFPLTLQFVLTAQRYYGLLNSLRAEWYGEIESHYYLSGREISGDTYSTVLQNMRDRMVRMVSSYFAPGYSSYGFSYTWDAAVSFLKKQSSSAGSRTVQQELYGLANDKLSTREGPGTQYREGGTYSVKGQYIQVLAKAYDSRNGIWWVKCVIPYKGESRILWTGYKRFDHSTLSLSQLPEEVW